MKKRIWLLFGAVILIIAVIMLVKHHNKQMRLPIDSEFTQYISSFTGGTISVQGVIRVTLAEDVSGIELNSPIEDKLFDFSPDVQGKAYWVDKRTIEFHPDKLLTSSTLYTGRLFLSKILKNLPSRFKTFEFQFSTITQHIVVNVDGYEPYAGCDLKWNKVCGVLQTTDISENKSVEKSLEAIYGKSYLAIKWDHDSNGLLHRFTIDSVLRTDKAGEVVMNWSADKLGTEEKGVLKVSLPSLDDFSAVSVSVNQGEQQCITVRFSDPLDIKQNLEGLIFIENQTKVSFEVNRMFVKVYPASQLKGGFNLVVDRGISNCLGDKIQKRRIFSLNFESINPSVRFLGKGVILPNSEELNLPFQAVNVKAIEVKIVKIYENNVTQFMQVNQLDGVSELTRAGRIIVHKRIKLNEQSPLLPNTWQTFALDLKKLFKQEPGAIYHVQLSFRMKDAIFPCLTDNSDENKGSNTEEDKDEDLTDNSKNWDGPSGYYNDQDESEYMDYNWTERNDPCKSSYYTGDNVQVSRNVLASDIGIIAKNGLDNKWVFAVANLITTASMSNVELDIYDYQKQLLATGKTDHNGICTLEPERKPYIVIARSSNQRGYLRIDDGSSLSVSNFDVSGESLQKGLKGFIYGERGVYRPGDTVFLTFILEDKLKQLPENHPVVLEVYNPQGQMVKRIVKSSGIGGMYVYSFKTEDSDPTGNWMVYIKIGSTTFSKSLKIETIKPNRLKILLDPGVSYLHNNFTCGLSAKWLTGATAKHLKTDVVATLSAVQTSFKGYESYTFDDPLKKFESVDKTIFEGNLDENGNVTLKADLGSDNSSPGMLQANFVTRVFEPGGDFSIDRFSIPYSPYHQYIGIRAPENEFGYLSTDTDQIFDVATLTEDGKLQDRQNLNVDIYQLQWRWWWDAGSDNLANFSNNTYSKPIYSTTISTMNGKGKVRFKLDYPLWGRFLVRITDSKGGHSCGKVVYFDWPMWRGRADRQDSKGVTMLSFNADKKSYRVGEKATITVPTSAGGHLLISLESGSQVLKTWWVETTKGETHTSFDITDQMAPNIYVNVTFIQPHNQTANDLPIRLYGIIPILVDNPATYLNPVISMSDVVKPETPFTVHISERNNRPMNYTLAIVDDGLLDLTRFKTPDPWTAFYGREALGVRTWDLYDMVMGAYGGNITSLFAVGGDDALKNGANQKANRFKPVVKFLGPFHLKNGTQDHIITLPQYIGSIRVMVVAENGGAFGKAEKTVSVRKPLMILGTLPRVLGPEEEVSLPVSVFALEKGIKNVSVEVKPNEYFSVLDEAQKTISITQTGEYDLSFHLKVKGEEGIGRVKIIARSGSEVAEYSVELNIRNPNSKLVNFTEAVVEPGKSCSLAYELIGSKKSNKATLEVSSTPPLNLHSRLDYLMEYPYGCVEQTTSCGFPLLFLEKFMDLSQQVHTMKDIYIKAAIQRLGTMVTTDGGFAYWPGSSVSNDWGSSYAGDFLLEAEQQGYVFPTNIKRGWLAFQHKSARDWNPNPNINYWYDNQLSQAYRLYTLAFAKEPELGAMNRLREIKNLNFQAAARLAAAYLLVGQAQEAKSLLAGGYTNEKEPPWFSECFGSEERDWAMLLVTYTMMGDRTAGYTYLKKLSESLSSEKWLSTQTTAYALLAISKYLDMTHFEVKNEYLFTGGGFSDYRISSKAAVSQMELKDKNPGKSVIHVSNTGKGMIYVRVMTEGIPVIGPTVGIEHNLKVHLVFESVGGKIIDVSKLTQGTDFIAEVTVQNGMEAHLTNLALKQIFPSGWEIGNDRMDKEDVASNAAVPFTYQDIRDDRVYTFFDLGRGETKTFKIRLTAAYLGHFYFPGIQCEAMYEGSVNAFEPGFWVNVVK